MYRDYLYSIDLLGRIVNTRRRRRALSTDLRRADGTSNRAARSLNPHDGAKKMKEEKRKARKEGDVYF